jgi:hypothetical protein
VSWLINCIKMDKKLKKLRDSLVREVKDPFPVTQQFGRYERFDKTCESKTRVVSKVSRIQLGDIIDVSSRPPHRVNPVGKIMATHVDSFKGACPSESLQELVEWGANQDEFYHTLQLSVLSLQVRFIMSHVYERFLMKYWKLASSFFSVVWVLMC